MENLAFVDLWTQLKLIDDFYTYRVPLINVLMSIFQPFVLIYVHTYRRCVVEIALRAFPHIVAYHKPITQSAGVLTKMILKTISYFSIFENCLQFFPN